MNHPHHNQHQIPKDSQAAFLSETETTRIISRADVSLFLKTYGRGITPEGAPDLVLVTGAGHTHHTFDIVGRALQQDFAVHTYDLRGHGNSGRLGKDLLYRNDDYAEDLAAVLTSVGSLPIPVVASSLGGLHALQLAATHPALISHLILVDIVPMIDEKTIRGLIRFFMRKDGFDSREHIEYLYKGLYPKRDIEEIRSELDLSSETHPNGRVYFRFDPRVVEIVSVEFLQGFQSFVPSVQCPVTLIVGDTDSVVPSEGLKDFRAALPEGVPFRKEVIKDAGHCPWREKPLEFCQIVREVLG